MSRKSTQRNAQRKANDAVFGPSYAPTSVCEPIVEQAVPVAPEPAIVPEPEPIMAMPEVGPLSINAEDLAALQQAREFTHTLRDGVWDGYYDCVDMVRQYKDAVRASTGAGTPHTETALFIKGMTPLERELPQNVAIMQRFEDDCVKVCAWVAAAAAAEERKRVYASVLATDFNIRL